MNEYEKIAFTVALAAFGWVLFMGNKNSMPVNASSTLPASSSSANSSVPWFMNYNVAAGFTGNITNAPVTDGNVPLPNTVINPQGAPCTTCQMFPFLGMTSGFST